MVHKKALQQFIRCFLKFYVVLALWLIKCFSDDDFHIFKEVERQGIKVAVAGIPKTIDNDIVVSYVSLIFY